MSARRHVASAVVIATLANAAPAAAEDTPPLLAVAVRNTLDTWAVLAGARREPVVLDKVQASATVALDRLGANGLSFHLQLFHVDGASLSERIGDIQTADAIDAVPATRLFEAWGEQRFGGDDRSAAFRVGLMDLNADFDSTSAASLFVNSSHGIGAELARSGLNGPSIYPVSAVGARLNIATSRHFALRYALLDGIPGNPARPRSFFIARLSPKDGTLSIAEADWRPDDNTRIAVGGWRYSHTATTLDGQARARDQGMYVEAERAFTKRVSAWVRLGWADGDVQPVSSYFGGGFILKGLAPGRSDDTFGIAIARATNSAQARSLNDVARAETSIEVTYQAKLSPAVSLQPDLQYIVDPSLDGRAPNALVLGLRLTTSFGLPKPAPATDPSDPTVTPPDPSPPPAPADDASH